MCKIYNRKTNKQTDASSRCTIYLYIYITIIINSIDTRGEGVDKKCWSRQIIWLSIMHTFIYYPPTHSLYFCFCFLMAALPLSICILHNEMTCMIRLTHICMVWQSSIYKQCQTDSTKNTILEMIQRVSQYSTTKYASIVSDKPFLSK